MAVIRPCPVENCGEKMADLGTHERIPAIEGPGTTVYTGFHRYRCTNGHVLFVDKAGNYYINENDDTSGPKSMSLGKINELPGWAE
jgi:hypothetical protein